MIYGVFTFFLVFLMVVVFSGPLATQVADTTSNASIFPTNGINYALINFLPAIFVLGAIMSYMTYNSFQRSR